MLGVMLVAFAVLGSLTALALRAARRLGRPALAAAALAGTLALGVLLLAD